MFIENVYLIFIASLLDDILAKAVSHLGDVVNSMNKKLDNRDSLNDLSSPIDTHYSPQIQASLDNPLPPDSAVELNNLRPFAAQSSQDAALLGKVESNNFLDCLLWYIKE